MFRVSLFFMAFASGSITTEVRAQEWDELRTAIVQKALPSIVAGANEWMADNDCVSCHRVTHGAWALNLSVGLKTDVTAQQRRQINSWSTDWTKVANPKVRSEAKRPTTLQNDADTVIQALLGVAAAQDSFDSDSSDEDWVDAYFTSLFGSQHQDGFWKPGGQLPLQKRPLRETQEVTTMWVLYALKELPLTHTDKQTVETKARGWLISEGHVVQGKSIEWWALKSLLENHDFDVNGGDHLSASVRLRSLQNDDGGWGWLVGEESDALGTGLALYALASDSARESEQARFRALNFLQSTQLSDGSWNVRGTKQSSRDDVVDTASYWGTCWAVIGLMQRCESSSVGKANNP